MDWNIKLDNNSLGNFADNLGGIGLGFAPVNLLGFSNSGFLNGDMGMFGNILGRGGKGGGASNPSIMTRDYTPQLDEMQRRQQQVYQQQQGLAQALLAQSQGQGPNPAQDMLNQQTGQNAAMQGSLMAGQRGASANPALLARQIAMQGANTQQQGVGQAATMQAQQQMAAQQALAQQQQAMAGNALQGEANQLGGLSSQNATQTTGQLGAMGINANAASQAAASKNNMMGGLMQGAGMAAMAMSDENQKTNVQGASLGAFLDSLHPHSYEYKDQSMPGTAPGKRTGVMAQDLEKSGPGKSMVANTPNGKMVDPAQGLGVALAALGEIHQRLKKIEGGGSQVQHMAQGGGVQSLPAFASALDPNPVPMWSGDGGNPFNMSGLMGAAKGGSSLASSGYNGMSMAGGPMDNMGSMGGNQFMTASHGAVVPGQAPVQGDSDRNDKVPAMLSPGEVVLPRSVTQSSDPVAKAAEFMKHLRSPKSQGYGGVIQARMACGGRVRR